MSIVGMVADVHISNYRRVGGIMTAGLNERCRMVLDVLRRTCQAAFEQGCSKLYILGDLYESATIGPRVIAATQDVLLEARSNGLEVVISTGNHDAITGDPGDHALGPLRHIAKIVDRPLIDKLGDLEVVVLPFYDGPASVWLRKQLSEVQREDAGLDEQLSNSASDDRSPPRVLALHLGIAHDGTPAFLQDECSLRLQTLQGLLTEFGYDGLFAGHWHDFIQLNTPNAFFVQLGALVPTGWDNPGVRNRGMLAVYSTNGGNTNLKYVSIPGPRFLQIKGLAGFETLKASVLEAAGSKLFVDWLIAPDDLNDAKEDLMIFKNRSLIHHGEVSLDMSQVTEIAREAATAARSEKTLAEALDAYVQKMPMPQDVQRTRILQLARKMVGLS